MKQTEEHEITVRIRTRYPQEDWAALVGEMLGDLTLTEKGCIGDIGSGRSVEVQSIK